MEKEEKDFNMFDWWKKVVLENYANFSGRARRAEFWWFNLVNFIVYMVCFLLIIVTTSIAPKSGLSLIPTVLMVVYILGTAIPSLAVAVRRLHDTGKSGLLILLPAIPFVGSIASIVLLVFYCLEGETGANQYGVDPKNPDDDSYYSNNLLGLSGKMPSAMPSIYSEQPPPPPQFNEPPKY